MITFKRAELYEEVWKKPVTKLAAYYDIPDALLRIVCKELNVPTPHFWLLD